MIFSSFCGDNGECEYWPYNLLELRRPIVRRGPHVQDVVGLTSHQDFKGQLNEISRMNQQLSNVLAQNTEGNPFQAEYLDNCVLGGPPRGTKSRASPYILSYGAVHEFM